MYNIHIYTYITFISYYYLSYLDHGREKRKVEIPVAKRASTMQNSGKIYHRYI